MKQKGQVGEDRNLKWGLGARVALGLMVGLGSYGAEAAKSYQFTGKVTGIHDDTVAISHGLDTLEFRRESRGLAPLKVGDEVTIWYHLDAQKAEPVRNRRQMPGQVAPTALPIPHDPTPGERKHIIIDDRAFYDARNGHFRDDAPGPGV